MEVFKIDEVTLKIYERLKTITILQDFTIEQIGRMFGKGTLRIATYEPGEYIIKQGTVDQWISCLIKGTIEIHKDGQFVKEISQYNHWFGEMSKVADSTRTADVVAQNQVMCLQLDASFLDRLPPEENAMIWAVFVNQFVKTLCSTLDSTTASLAAALKRNSELEVLVGQKEEQLEGVVVELERIKQEKDKLLRDIDYLKQKRQIWWAGWFREEYISSLFCLKKKYYFV